MGQHLGPREVLSSMIVEELLEIGSRKWCRGAGVAAYQAVCLTA